jgi:hypothetical protein
VPAYDLILIGFVELAKVAAPAPDAYDEVFVTFRMALSITQRFDIKGVTAFAGPNFSKRQTQIHLECSG